MRKYKMLENIFRIICIFKLFCFDRKFNIRKQYKVILDEDGKHKFRFDLVIHDIVKDENIAVMDTKYKRDDESSEEDIQQIVAYAVAMGTSEVYYFRACETNRVETKRKTMQ